MTISPDCCPLMLSLQDPNAPKKPLTSFMYFSNAIRESVKSENPGESHGSLTLANREKLEQRQLWYLRHMHHFQPVHFGLQPVSCCTGFAHGRMGHLQMPSPSLEVLTFNLPLFCRHCLRRGRQGDRREVEGPVR